MGWNQTEFVEILGQLKDTARLQGDLLTSEQINEAFDGWDLRGEQIALIHDHFRKDHIGIDAPADDNAELSDDDVDFLEMYLAELKELAPVTDGEKRAVMMSALAGDEDARAKLVEIFLPQVVEISRLYAGQGTLVEDLIGEGNVAAACAVGMLECVEGIDEVEGFIARMVMDAMEAAVGEDSQGRQISENVLNKVNDVNDKAKELYDMFLRKVTAKEVADELGISEEEVREAMRFSADHIDYIERMP